MPQTSTTFDAVLKEHYGPQICKVLNNKVRLRKLLQKNKRPTDGRRVVFPAHVGRNHSFRYQNAGDDLATAGNQETVQVIVPYFDAFSHVRITEKVIKQSKSDRGAFERALAFELEGATADMAVQENRAAFGTGDGKLAEVESIAGAVITLKHLGSVSEGSGINGNASNRYLRVNDVIDVYTSGGVARLQGATISAISIANNTITYTGGVGAAPVATDGIYLQQPSLGSPVAVDPMGVAGAIDDGTFVTLFQNVNRTTYPQWKSQIINLGSWGAEGSLTLNVMQRLEDMLTDAGYGDDYLIMCHASVRNQYAQIAFPDRRYTSRKYDAGFVEGKEEASLETELTFNGHPVIAERDCPWQTMFFLNREAFQVFELADVHWVEDDKGAVMRLVPGKAGLYEGQLAHYYNLGVESMGPNCCGALRYISSTVDRVYLP